MLHSPIILRCITVIALSSLMAQSLSAGEANQPWKKLYTGAEATGEHVIALWQFLPGQETRDNSGKGHDLKVRGETRFVQEGPFGAAMESFPADAKNDRAQGAAARDADDLSPSGAFTLEAWFAGKPEMDKFANVWLLDKKYFNYVRDTAEANWDYCLYLSRTGLNKRRLMASLGFGKDSDFITGPEIEVEPGRWIHVAFTYDGAGICRFFVNGELLSKVRLEGRGGITPGRYDLVIGDRYGSVHGGFPGYIAQVRVLKGIPSYFSGGLTIGVGRARTVFVRREKNAEIPLVIGNDTSTPLHEGRAQIWLGGGKKELPLPDLAPNQELTIPISVDTSLRPDTYTLQVKASASSAGNNLNVEKEIPITIVPRPLPNQMPVVMWGGGDIERLKKIGFTHQLVGLVNYDKVWNAGKPTEAMPPDQVEQQSKMLDQLLKEGLYAIVYLYPGSWVTRDADRKAKYNRVDRQGKVREHDNVCGNFPEIRQFCYNVGASVAQTFGHHPALQGALIHSEVRDGTDLCFHDHDRQAFRQCAGYDIPDEVMGKSGLSYQRISNFPADRVVRDDDRILTFYRWFWKNGDGWNPLHSEVHRGLKSTGRQDLWTFFDPAVRVPDIWGSGGDVDVISQWTYSYPDPIKIGQATDELFAMAEGKPGQKVMKMTQIIWYRSGTAPIPEMPQDEAKRAPWEKEKPQAPFITIAPDHLREAFWSKISRPIRGIMYHGWQSLVETGNKTGYVFTHPQTQEVLAELTRDVVRPLGPTLLQVPDRKTDVAILESFASQIFAGRGSYGWSGSWEADMHLILQWAHLQPKILFDETLVRDGLDAYKVLVMPNCDVLTESVVQKIKQFQKRGGIVVADENLCPAIIPDIVIPSFKRSGRAAEDKAALQARALELCRQLDPFYTRYGEASNPDVVIRFRQFGDADYLFVLNDKRTYGDYVGQYGRVMEKGLPSAATLSIRRREGFVYDLVSHKAVPVRTSAGQMQFDVDFAPGDGKVFLISSQKIHTVKLDLPPKAKRGNTVVVTLSITDAKGVALTAVVPVRVEILDPQGRLAEGSGFYGARNGRHKLALDLAPNDLRGAWTIRVTELASGKSRQQQFIVH